MLQKNKLHIIISFFILWFSYSAKAQDLSQLGGEGSPFKVNGGFTLSQLYNTSFSGESRREPYNYFLNGNINFSIYGLNVPFSFNFSNQQFGFQQPFNQYGISPTYEWITLHAGYTSMSFSPYTLSGHLFLGGGVELQPEGPWSVSAMAGRLQKAIEPDTASGADPAYHRFGYGAKVGYSGNTYQLDLILFKSKDDPNSIIAIPDSTEIFPEENMVIGLNGRTNLFNRVSLSFEYAQSALSRDIRSEETLRETFEPFPTDNFLFTHRVSTSYYHAFKTNINYGGDGYTVGLGFERVDPEYKTHGAYYFNSDLQNITVNGATQLFDNKVSISTNVGLQQDNLNNKKINQMTRWVGALNVSYAASKKLSLNSSYSNFQTYTVIRSQFDDINNPNPLVAPVDTLDFTQISQNLNLSANYILKASENITKALNTNLSMQQTSDEQAGEEQPSGSMFYNGNLGLSQQWKSSGFSLFTSFNASWQEAAGMENMTLGPVVSANKALLNKKLRLSFSTAFNQSYSNGQLRNTILNCRLSATMVIKEKHNLSLTNALVTRQTTATEETEAQSFAELNGTLTYSYKF